MRNQNYTIHYEGIQTRTIFSMNHTRSIYMLSEDKLSEERNANIFLKSIGKKGTSYRIQGVRLNYQNEEVMDAINRSDTFSYEEVPDKALINLYLSQKNLFSHRIKGSANAIADEMRRLLKKRAEDIKVKDTVLPQELPDRVYELAKEITKDYDTTYDKVKAIEAYVSQYTYTKSPGSVKEGEDFVDAFLFDGKQGYCTYYASAMTILARCIGIPARYVEGYLCKFDEKSGTSYLVRNSSAHAWVEIYFEGIGFLTFEPTSAYQSYCYPTWEVEEKNYEDDEITYEDIHIEKIDRPISQPAIVIEEEAPHTYIGLVIALCCLGGMLVLFFLVVLLLYVRFQKIRRKASPEEQIRLRYLRIELYLKRIGYQRAESETLLSFAQRVEEQVSDCNITYLLLTNLYMEHLYGMTPVTEDVVSDFILYESEIRAKNKGIRRRLTCLFDDLSFMLRA